MIDNIATGVIKLDRYCHISATMIYLPISFNSRPSKCLEDTSSNTTLVDLPWKTTNNRVDCGIFSMRHMEIYMGGGVKKWKTGLLQESAAQNKQLN
ncbi:hypothetical protein R6Q57_009938 [Mikania cordata]